MQEDELRKRIPAGELVITSSRSSGPGGQNVNKVSTKIELRYNLVKSNLLTEQEKQSIFSTLRNRITSGGDIIITSQSERTQLRNRVKAEEKFYRLLAGALTQDRERKPTSPTISSSRTRVEKKKKRGSLKKLRSDSDLKKDDI